MFSGMSNHSIDSKGRIVLPASFREELGETFYLVKGMGKGCIQAMSETEYEARSKKISELPFNMSSALRYEFNGTAKSVTPNAQGRVIVPPKLREIAGIDDDALVVGMGDIIEIWNQQRFDEFMASQQDVIAEALSMLRL